MQLAARRSIVINGKELAKTPLLVPSFSSKGFPKIKEMISTAEEVITDSILVSAYDIHYDLVPKTYAFPEFIFLDSGGYECGKDVEFSDLGLMPNKAEEWTPELHKAALDNWVSATPTILISYDHPKNRRAVIDQINAANSLFHGRKAGKELLIKPETVNQSIIQLDSIIAHIHKLSDFDVVGLTEKELGSSLITRMKNIAKIRMALDKANIRIPIHVFGSLDTISTPLYFLAGADIFDGLTWLRFAFRDGVTMYTHNYSTLKFGPRMTDEMAKGRILADNYFAIAALQDSMHRFLNANDFREFTYHQSLLEQTYKDLIATLAEV